MESGVPVAAYCNLFPNYMETFPQQRVGDTSPLFTPGVHSTSFQLEGSSISGDASTAYKSGVGPVPLKESFPMDGASHSGALRNSSIIHKSASLTLCNNAIKNNETGGISFMGAPCNTESVMLSTPSLTTDTEFPMWRQSNCHPPYEAHVSDTFRNFGANSNAKGSQMASNDDSMTMCGPQYEVETVAQSEKTLPFDVSNSLLYKFSADDGSTHDEGISNTIERPSKAFSLPNQVPQCVRMAQSLMFSKYTASISATSPVISRVDPANCVDVFTPGREGGRLPEGAAGAVYGLAGAKAAEGATPGGLSASPYAARAGYSGTGSQDISLAQVDLCSSGRAGRTPFPGDRSASHLTDTHFHPVKEGLSQLYSFALEKQMMQRSKEDLVQILMELVRCQPEASTFIYGKLRLLEVPEERHASMAVESFGAVGSAPGSANEAPNSTSSCCIKDNRKSRSYGKNDADQLMSSERKVTNSEKVMKSYGASRNTPSDEACLPLVLLCGKSGTDHPGTRFYEPDGQLGKPQINSMDALRTQHFSDAADMGLISTLATPVAQRNTNRLSITATHTGNNKTTTITKRTQVRSQDRSFSPEAHPCLRWYGACRNLNSCVFATAPQNLCLKWIRASCTAGDECSGVHRLPEPCTFDVFMVYQLNHGMKRSEASSWITSRLSSDAFPKCSSPLGKDAAQRKSTSKQLPMEGKDSAHSAIRSGETGAMTPSEKTDTPFLQSSQKQSNNSTETHACVSPTEMENFNPDADGGPHQENVYRCLNKSFANVASAKSPDEKPQLGRTMEENNWRGQEVSVNLTRSQCNKMQQDHQKPRDRYPVTAFGIANRSMPKSAVEHATSAKNLSNK